MPIRKLEIVRGAWGLALLIAPRTVLERLHRVRADTTAVRVARILGVRHLFQATVSGLNPTPAVLALGAWVDVTHASTALGLAAADSSRRRAALTDALIAGAGGAFGIRDLGHPERTAEAGGWREELAGAVLDQLPLARPLRARARIGEASRG